MTTTAQTPTAVHAHNEAALLRLQLEHAAVKLATAQAENRRLRRMTTNGRQGRILHRAAADARQIVGWRFANYSVTRRNCEAYGMPRRRWIWAVALLRLARILAPNGTADEFELTELADCLAAIDHAVTVCESGGLERLIVRMPRGAVRAR